MRKRNLRRPLTNRFNDEPTGMDMTRNLELATDRQNEIDQYLERENRDHEDSTPGLRERPARTAADNSSLEQKLASLEEEH